MIRSTTRTALLGAALALAAAGCTATASGTVTPGASASPTASTRPAGTASATPSAAASSAAPAASASPAASPSAPTAQTLEVLDLKVDGQPVAITNAVVLKTSRDALSWEVGKPSGNPVGTWYVGFGASFKKDVAGATLTTADVMLKTVTLFKTTGAFPEAYTLGGEAITCTIEGGKITMKVNGDASPTNAPAKVKVEGTLTAKMP